MVRTLLVMAASALLIGTAPAGRADTASKPADVPPPLQRQSGAYPAPGPALPYSFAEVFNFSVGVDYPTQLASATAYTPRGTAPELTQSGDLVPALYAGSDAAGSLLGASRPAQGPSVDLATSPVPAADAASASSAATASGQSGGRFLVSLAAVPEPSGWAMLLCALVIMAFMARRKSGAIES